jgi:two-component system chemotaxis sensor kinase CheA
MLEMFIFETNQLLEQLEGILLTSEKNNKISKDDVNEIFRIMHTIKGSAAMMMYTGISSLAHALEDLFQYIREASKSYNSGEICDYALKSADYIRSEVAKISEGVDLQTEQTELALEIREYFEKIKTGKKNKVEISQTSETVKNQKYYITAQKADKKEEDKKYIINVRFDEDCQMENVRAYSIIHNLESLCSEILHRPPVLFDSPDATEIIARNGIDIYICTEFDEEKIKNAIDEALFVKEYTVNSTDDYSFDIMDLLMQNVQETLVEEQIQIDGEKTETDDGKQVSRNTKQNIISVNVSKLDKLMDLVGEIVITESMVTGNKELKTLKLESFNKSARQLRKLTDELQDIVMSIRMVPIASTFNKMNRIVRDMSKSLNKDVLLEIVGEDTEVDKNIIDNLSDPLMHLIRNAMDHGIESAEQRKLSGKPMRAVIKLEAQNTGGDVLITVCDDGKGLDKDNILKKAKEKGLLIKAESEMSDKDIYSLILLPGFSTKEKITEYSGRGVGMDVVKKNLDKLGGNISIESALGKGTTINIRIPLTLAIVDGMEVSVGKSIYTVPTISIKESFKAEKKDIVVDTDGNEMIMIRGNCYPIVRLHRMFGVVPKTQNLLDGIMMLVENQEKHVVLFADELLGEQQVVVKPIPAYLMEYGVMDSGIGGCTILGDGSISLILDVMGTIDNVIKS